MASDSEPPIVDGILMAAPAPEGWEVDLETPVRTSVLEHYLIFGIMGSFAFMALCQRFYTKIFLSKGLQIDDFFMFLAWMTSVATQAMMCHQVARQTLGLHMWEVVSQKYVEDWVVTYATAGIFMLCNGFTKLSLLTFYLHLSPQTWWRISVWTTIGIVALSTTIITLMLYIHCDPVAKAYDLTIEHGSCLNVAILYIATAVANIVTDCILFVLPMPMVLQLRMGVFQKVGAIVIFGIGSMTISTSAVRLVYLLKVLNTADLTWDAARANVWSLVEANLFIICASMPTLRKFFKHFAPRIMGYSTGNSTSAKYAGRYPDRIQTIGGISSRGRRIRSQYENFKDTEMEVFESSDRNNRDGKNPGINEINVDGGSDKWGQDNGSEKAILQTKTVDIRYY